MVTEDLHIAGPYTVQSVVRALRLVDIVVPFAAAYRPVWLGLGTLALDLIAALMITSLVRQRLGARAWRAVHWLAYAAWPAAFLHGLFTGTDAGEPWMRAVAVACAVTVSAALIWRLSTTFNETARVRGQVEPLTRMDGSR